jgi:hypothetical protein
VLVKVYSMGGMKQTITREELIALGKRFGVTPLQSLAVPIEHLDDRSVTCKSFPKDRAGPRSPSTGRNANAPAKLQN